MWNHSKTRRINYKDKNLNVMILSLKIVADSTDR